MALFLSGDGGWAKLVRDVSHVLVDSGIAVVGLNSRAYLGRRRTPDEIAADAARLIAHYRSAWGRDSVLLIGYSRGADIVPFIANRLPPSLRARVALVALRGPAERASFVFHWIDLVEERSKPTDTPIAPEIERLRGTRVLCLYGRDEVESLCRSAVGAEMDVVERSGKHSFDGNHPALAFAILHARATNASTTQ
jgi:type IV secretory pathway VirJ component